jgi:hypothetical protein
LRAEAGSSSSSNCSRFGTDACNVTDKLRMASDEICWNSRLSTASGTAVDVGICALAAHQQFERIEPLSDFVSLKAVSLAGHFGLREKSALSASRAEDCLVKLTIISLRDAVL